MTTKLLCGLFAGALALSGSASAADDPKIPKADKDQIQEAMSQHIRGLSDSRGFPVFDHTAGKLVWVKLDELHSGVVKKGDVYASCADFVAADGTKFDIDFLVQKDKSTFEVVSALVHSRDGKKSPYDVEH